MVKVLLKVPFDIPLVDFNYEKAEHVYLVIPFPKFSGFTDESFRILEAKVLEEAQKGRAVRVSLVFDEVSIRKQIDWTGQNFVGCVDHGKAMP